MSVQVVTVYNREPDRAKEPYYRLDVFKASAARHGITPIVLGLGEPWGGLMTKPRRLRQWLRAGGCTADTLIVCDAFDIVFTTPAEEIEEKYHKHWGHGLPIVFNAEKGIFPRAELAPAFDGVQETWRYLNSGFMIGPPARILTLLEVMWLDDIHDDVKAADELHGGAGRWINPNDQGWYQLLYCAQVVPIELDYEAYLCQCLSACTIEEFDLSRAHIMNVATQTTPHVFHFNGGSKNDLMPIFLKKWGLE